MENQQDTLLFSVSLREGRTKFHFCGHAIPQVSDKIIRKGSSETMRDNIIKKNFLMVYNIVQSLLNNNA